MSTSFLSREELHARVDALFDEIEDEDTDAVAVAGQLTGNMQVSAPSESKNHFRADPTVGYAPFAFSGGALPLGEAPRDGLRANLFGTVIVNREQLGEDVRRALDGDEDAVEKVAGEA